MPSRGRLVHLAEYEGDFGVFVVAFLDNARRDHFVIEVVAFAGPLANAAEHGNAAMLHRDVVDEFLNGNGLADARAAEEADFSALRAAPPPPPDLNPGAQLLRLRRLLGKSRRLTMDRPAQLRANRAFFIDRRADDVENTAQHFRSDRHLDSVAGVNHVLPAHQAVGHVHGDAADSAFAQMLRNLQHQRLAVIVRMQRIQDRGNRAFLELHVDDSAQHLQDLSYIAFG